MTYFEAERLFSSTDIIVPKRRMYYIETLESHFNHMKLSTDDDLKVLKEAVRKVSPQYVNACDVVFRRTWGHMFNMFIMRREVFWDYYKWFFTVLSEVERNIDMSSSIHPNRKSIIGYVAEFLLDIYLEANHLPYKEIDTVFLEKQNELKKVFKFFIRKLRKNKSSVSGRAKHVL